VNVPRFAELTAASVYNLVQHNRSVMRYLPDPQLDERGGGWRAVAREFLFNVVNTLDEAFFQQSIAEAYRLRKEHEAARANKGQMEITGFMYGLIQGSQQLSKGKSGRARPPPCGRRPQSHDHSHLTSSYRLQGQGAEHAL
jgi:hypothetical protein